MPSYLQKRNGVWHYRRAVPQEFSHLDRRSFVKHSTKIRVGEDRGGVRASQAATLINEQVERYWVGLATGAITEAQQNYDQARKRAKSLGYSYVPAGTLAGGRIQDILDRLDKISAMGGITNRGNVTALLGGEQPPPLLLSRLLPTYEDLVRTDVRDMSPDQLRKWRGHKKKAIANFISVVGDKPITELTREDALDFREWWQDKVISEGLDNITANKDMGRLNAMIRGVEMKMRLGLTLIFSGLRLEEGKENKRDPFDPAFIQNKILTGSALAALNDDARRVIYIMIETGMRPSEIVNLTRETIVLDAKIPHVMVRPDGRRMKTDESQREIPLVGVALAAAKAQPEGFARYRDKSAGLSGAINKFMTENSLRPTPAHTLYSIRHSFEDRLTAVEAPEKLIANLMGHKYGRPRYGKGPSLAQKHKWLSKIAFKPPLAV